MLYGAYVSVSGVPGVLLYSVTVLHLITMYYGLVEVMMCLETFVLLTISQKQLLPNILILNFLNRNTHKWKNIIIIILFRSNYTKK